MFYARGWTSPVSWLSCQSYAGLLVRPIACSSRFICYYPQFTPPMPVCQHLFCM